MDAAGVFQLQVLVLADEVQKIRFMLEEVRVQLLVTQRHVRLDEVGELDDLELDVLLRENRLDLLEHFRVRYRRCAYLQRDLRAAGGRRCARRRGLFVSAAAARRENDQEQRGENQKQLFHFISLPVNIGMSLMYGKAKKESCQQRTAFFFWRNS